MPQCQNCGTDAEFEENGGELNCTACGAVVEGQNFSSEITFAKGAGGENAAVGQYVSDGAGTRISGGRVYNQVDSHERSLAKGRDEIQQLVLQLNILPAQNTIDGAHRLYRLALLNNFTRGRRTAQVAGACLYIFCRQEQKPFMLIDISDVLQINVFALGAVFLQMCHILHLENQPMFFRPIDPSLYIHRFVHKLMNDNQEITRQKQNAVTNTALRLVKSMKRDWMQTGRRPSGICGAALFIATHIHGLEFTRREIVAKIHIGEATLAKRVTEFASTAAGELTLEEFDQRGRALETEQMALLENTQPSEEQAAPGCRCIHIDMGAVIYSSGMCVDCYKEYLENAGGQLQGHNPPAYTQGLIKASKQQQQEADEEEEDEQEVLALPAPGDDLSQENQMEAEMHAAIASAELADYAQAALPKAELRRSTRAATRAAQKQPCMQPPPAIHSQAPSPQTPEEPPSATLPTPSPQEQGPAQQERPAPEGSGQMTAAGANQPSSQAGVLHTGPQAREAATAPGSTAQPPSTAEQAHGEGPQAQNGSMDLQAALGNGEAEAHPETQLALTIAEADDQADERIETLSDLSDMDMTEFIVEDESEIRQKEQIWDTMNQEYLEQQELKRLQLEEAHKARTDKLAEQEAKEAGEGRKRGRGRPLGSKTKLKPEDCLGPSDTPLESTKNLLAAKKMSGKINFDRLNDLFEDDEPESSASKKRRVGTAIAAREQEKRNAEDRKKRQVQARLMAETKGKQKSGSGRLGSGTLGGLRSGGGLSALGHFSRKADEPASPSRFRPTSPSRGGKR